MQDYLYLFFISMVPLVELRGAMILAAVQETPFLGSLAVCVLGNILPVPFLIRFSKQLLMWLAGWPKIGSFFQKIIDRANRKALEIGTAELIGLYLFVALPIPGTGAWMGSLVAAVLQLRLWKAFWAIFAGVFTCGILMGFLSFGLAEVIQRLFI